jgi:hypothetical protein
MTRIFIFLSSVMLTLASFSTAGSASDLGELRFALSATANAPDRVQLTLREEQDRNNRGSGMTNSQFAARDLVGLAPGQLFTRGNTPLRFALVRDAGRADCAGVGGHGQGSGSCRFSPDPQFLALLRSHGIAQPDRREAFGMMLLGVRRDLVEALGAARYPSPTIGELTGLAALRVTPEYIRDLASRGYRPDRLGDLTSFKALGISPDYIDRMSRAGFGRIPASTLVQFKALGVSPDYVAGLRRAGYAPLRANEVVQMKAMGITAADFANFRRAGLNLSVDKMVQAKALGLLPSELRASR